MGTREDSINSENLNGPNLNMTDESENMMRFESHRLETFQRWPPNAQVGAGKIARAGFYYTGSYLEVMYLQQSLKQFKHQSLALLGIQICVCRFLKMQLRIYYSTLTCKVLLVVYALCFDSLFWCCLPERERYEIYYLFHTRRFLLSDKYLSTNHCTQRIRNSTT